MTYDVFISYLRKDVQIVDRIEKELGKYQNLKTILQLIGKAKPHRFVDCLSNKSKIT